MTVDDWKDLLPKKSSMNIWAMILLVYLISCEDKIGYKILMPEETEEQEQEPTI